MGNKKKLLFIVPSMVGGGVERCLLNLINALDHNRYKIDILAIKSGGDLINQIPTDVGYRYTWKKEWRLFGKRIPGSDRIFSLVYQKCPEKLLAKLFIKKDYDVVIDYWGQEGLKLATGTKGKKIAFIHFDMNTEGLQTAYFPYVSHKELKSAYASMDTIACVSKDSLDSMEKRFHFENPKLLSVKYNINLNDVILSKAEEPLDESWEKFFSKKEGKILCAVGRLTWIKGYDRLIKICARLKEEGIAFKLLILGQGEEQENLEKLIDVHQLHENVILGGFHKNPYSFMKASDLFICSSHFEGFSTVVSEAVILGVPVLTTDCTGAKEILGESEYGLVTGKDDESLYEGLKKILIDENLYQRYCNAVIKRQKFFDNHVRLKETEELFE